MHFRIESFGAGVLALTLLLAGCKQIAGYPQALAPAQPPDVGVMDGWQPNDGAVDAASALEVSVPPRQDAAVDGASGLLDVGFPAEAGVVVDVRMHPAPDAWLLLDTVFPVEECATSSDCEIFVCCEPDVCLANPTTLHRLCESSSVCDPCAIYVLPVAICDTTTRRCVLVDKG